MEKAALGAADPYGSAAGVFGVQESALVGALARAEGHTLTNYQRAFLADASPLRAVLKARQTGFSWVFALEALAAAMARGRFGIFVSLNREEAAEKVLYAREMYEALEPDALPGFVKPRLVKAGSHEMRLAGGGRLLSFPCRAPRGKASADLYLDEMAFYPNAEILGTVSPIPPNGWRRTRYSASPSGYTSRMT